MKKQEAIRNLIYEIAELTESKLSDELNNNVHSGDIDILESIWNLSMLGTHKFYKDRCLLCLDLINTIDNIKPYISLDETISPVFYVKDDKKRYLKLKKKIVDFCISNGIPL